MPLSRPTLAQLNERITNDLSTRLIGSATPARRSVIRILATVIAGAMHLAYGFLAFLAKQLFADTAEEEFLRRIASIFGLGLVEATFSQGNGIITGTTGAVIPASSILQNPAGTQYTTDVESTLSGGTATVAMTCTTAGVIGNMDAGETLQFVTPISLVNNTVTVDTGGLAGGGDEETIEELRTRLLAFIQSPPHGGNEADYIAWAKQVNGVTRVFVYPAQYGNGTVGVTFMRDNDVGSAIPDAGEVTAVQTYIDSVRPVTATVTVYAPTGSALNFTIHLVTNDTTAIRAAVQAELEDLLLRESEPGGTLLLSHINEAISSATGETDHTLTSPNANVVAGAGIIKTMGTITWT